MIELNVRNWSKGQLPFLDQSYHFISHLNISCFSILGHLLAEQVVLSELESFIFVGNLTARASNRVSNRVVTHFWNRRQLVLN